MSTHGSFLVNDSLFCPVSATFFRKSEIPKDKKKKKKKGRTEEQKATVRDSSSQSLVIRPPAHFSSLQLQVPLSNFSVVFCSCCSDTSANPWLCSHGLNCKNNLHLQNSRTSPSCDKAPHGTLKDWGCYGVRESQGCRRSLHRPCGYSLSAKISSVECSCLTWSAG